MRIMTAVLLFITTLPLASQQANPEAQKDLWKEAGARAEAAGLDQVPTPATAVEARTRATASNAPTYDLQGAGSMNSGIAAVAEILNEPAFERYAGLAHVASSNDRGLELDLGQARTIEFLARAAGRPFRANVGALARIDFRNRDDAFDRQQILAVRLADGDGIVSVVDTQDTPVTVNVPLYFLSAKQVGDVVDNMMNVEVRVRDVTRMMKPGEVVELGNLTVGLKASTALQGAEIHRTEGKPYAIELVAWPTGQ